MIEKISSKSFSIFLIDVLNGLSMGFKSASISHEGMRHPSPLLAF